jgi:hypothetical protein
MAKWSEVLPYEMGGPSTWIVAEDHLRVYSGGKLVAEFPKVQFANIILELAKALR